MRSYWRALALRRGNSSLSPHRESCAEALLSFPPGSLAHLSPSNLPLPSQHRHRACADVAVLLLDGSELYRCKHHTFLLDVHHLSALLTPSGRDALLHPFQQHSAVLPYLTCLQWLTCFREQGRQSPLTQPQIILQRVGFKNSGWDVLFQNISHSPRLLL